MRKNSSNIVAAFGMTHTPGLGNQLHAPPKAKVDRIMAGFDTVNKQIADAKPDVIIAFINDHFDMFNLHKMPSFSISLGDTHWGPSLLTEQWIQMKRGPVPGSPKIAMDIYSSLMEYGIEMFRTESAEFIHNVLMPKKYLWPDLDIPIVPIFLNCFAPPLPTWRRAYELGAAVRKVIDRRPEKIALLASGGVSHWPPITVEKGEENDPLKKRLLAFQIKGIEALKEDPSLPLSLLQREAEMVASGQQLINEEWDREILDRLASGDSDYFKKLNHDEVKKVAGPGGAEMMMWVALMGAMNDAKADLVVYEPVKEWMGGVGLISYDASINGN